MSDTKSEALGYVVAFVAGLTLMSLLVRFVTDQRDDLCREVYALSPTATDSLRVSLRHPHCIEVTGEDAP